MQGVGCVRLKQDGVFVVLKALICTNSLAREIRTTIGNGSATLSIQVVFFIELYIYKKSIFRGSVSSHHEGHFEGYPKPILPPGVVVKLNLTPGRMTGKVHIKVCDALCGAGKTSACIRMMNERTDARFIFVTQFLSEVERIKEKCKARKFLSPEGDLESGMTKLKDIRQLLKEGRNIATTHSLFTSYTEDIKQLVSEKEYILVLDETVNTFNMSGLKPCDINLLKNHDIIRAEDGHVEWSYSEYESDDYDGEGKFSEEVKLARSKNLLEYDGRYLFWSIPPELFACFKEAYVLTYLFHAQLLRYFFDLYGFKYELIGVKGAGGKYEFCDIGEMDRRRDLRDKIHILEHKKLNEIGAKRTDLSVSSYTLNHHEEGEGLCDKMRRNLVNLFRNIFKAPAEETMWTVFKDCRSLVAAKGFASSFVPYNKRASNEYANRRYLAYCVNNFARPWEARYYREHGVDVDQDTYALSIIVQWIFRSAIRKGEEVWVYVPSARMRSLLKQWLENLAAGKDLEPVKFKGKGAEIRRGGELSEREGEEL